MIRAAIVLAAALAAAGPALAQDPAQMAPAARPPAVAAMVLADGAHDFDFEFGTWKTHLSRRLKPLTGSTAWVEYDGLSTVRPVWNGAANLGELELDGPAGRLEGLSLRLYDPQTRQWNVTFANSAVGTLTPSLIGGFKDGRGEFYNQDTLNGRAIQVRFIFSEIGPRFFRLEQAFSADGGKTWEANWLATFTKL